MVPEELVQKGTSYSEYPNGDPSYCYRFHGEQTDEEEEEEDIEVKEKTIEKEVFLGGLELIARQARKVGKRWRTTIEVQFLLDRTLEVSACESGQADRSTLTV